MLTLFHSCVISDSETESVLKTVLKIYNLYTSSLKDVSIFVICMLGKLFQHAKLIHKFSLFFLLILRSSAFHRYRDYMSFVKKMRYGL